jgi:hypothetical protein
MFIGTMALIAYRTGGYIIIGRYTHGTVIYKNRSPEEFAGWMNLSVAACIVLFVLTFVHFIQIEKMLDSMYARLDALIAKLPSWWPICFWGIAIVAIFGMLVKLCFF